MAVLRFKQVYRDAVLAGEKTQTLRAKVPRGVREGAVVDAASSYSQPPWGRLRVDALQWLDVGDIDDDMARQDGFESATALRAEIERLYPGVTRLVAIKFESL